MADIVGRKGQVEAREIVLQLTEFAGAENQSLLAGSPTATPASTTDPDDVFLKAEERRKEIAQQERKAKRHSKKTANKRQ